MRFISVVTGALLFILVSVAWAQGCTVTATAVNFGNYDSYSPLDGTGSVNVTCGPGLNYSVSVDAGANSGGAFTSRKARLAGGSDTASYNIYRDTSRTEIWGDGTNNTFVRTGVGTGAEEKLFIYGRLPGGQKVASGVYSDTLTITVEW